MAEKKTKLLRPAGVAERLQISRSYAYQLIGAGHFTVIPMGRALAVTSASVEAYIQRQRKLFDAIENPGD